MGASIIRVINLGPFRHQSSRPSALVGIDLRFGVRAVAALNTLVEVGGLYPAGVGSLAYGAGEIRKPPAFSPPQLVAILDMRFTGAGKPGVSTGDPIDFSFARAEEAGPEQEIFAASFSSSELGLGRVWLAQQYVKVTTGLPPGAFGKPFFELFKRYMHPASFTSSQVGRPAPVYNRDRVLYVATGFTTHAVSKPAVSAEVRRIYVSSFDASAFGKPAAALAKRPIVVSGFSSAGVGLAWASFHTRWISGVGNIKLVNYWSNTNLVSHKNRYIQAVGAPSKHALGTLLIRDALADMVVPGIAGFGSGTARVEYVRRHVVPASWVSSGYGMAWPINRNRLVLAASVNDWRVGIGADVYHYEGQLARVGLGIQTAFGITNVHQWIRYVQPHGWDNNPIHRRRPIIYNSLEQIQHFASRITTEFGVLRFDLHDRYIQVTSIPGKGNGLSAVGFDWVQLARRYVAPAVIYPGEVSHGLTIADRAFYFKPESISPRGFGPADVSHEVRSVRPRSWASSTLGHPRGYTKIASIYPAFIFSFAAGQSWVADGERVVRPIGVGSDERVAGGSTFVARALRAVGATGWNSFAFSVYTSIKDAKQTVLPRGLPPVEQAGGAFVELSRREIQIPRWQDTELPPTQYGRTVIGLGDRTLGVFSINQWRIGVGVTVYGYRGDIDNVSVGDSSRLPKPMIADAIRYVAPSEVQTTFFGAYGRVHNAAFLVSRVSVGAVEGHSVLAFVANRNRVLKAVSIGPEGGNSVVGAVFIAPAVRALEAFGVRTIQYVPQTHWVSYHNRILKPTGCVPPDIAGKRELEVYERFSIIRTMWMQVRDTSWGALSIVNRNRRVTPYAYDYAEFGRVKFELAIRHIREVSVGTGSFGRARIADRKQQVSLAARGVSYLEMSLGARVRNLLPDPPWTREVAPLGIGRSMDLFGYPRVRAQAVYEVQVPSAFGMGVPRLTRNQISINTGILEYNWGVASVVGPVYLTIASIKGPLVLGIPRMTPHTIFGPYGDMAPDRYQPDQPPEPHVVDGRKYMIPGTSSWDTTKNGGGWVKAPRVEHRIRYVYPKGWNSQLISASAWAHDPREVTPDKAKPRYIYPLSWKLSRIGWVGVLPYDILVTAYGIMPPALPKVSVWGEEAWIRTLNVLGMSSYGFGRPLVDFKNRSVYPTGTLMSLYGRTTIWFRVRYVNASGRGISSTNRFSDRAWVSNYIRTVYPSGWEAFNPSVAFEFEDTKVRNQYEGDVIVPRGLVHSAYGMADVDWYTKYVVPRGMFPTPPLRPRLKARAKIQVLGFESQVFGQVRKYEEGVIYPHEFDAGAVGTAVVSMPRQVQGFVSSMVNYPTVAAHIGPQGIESEGVGATVLKNEICCGGCG